MSQNLKCRPGYLHQNFILFRLHFQSEHLEAFFCPEIPFGWALFDCVGQVVVEQRKDGEFVSPPQRLFSLLTPIFQTNMWSKNLKFELLTQEIWSKCGDSKPGPPAPKAGALPTALHPVIELFYPAGSIPQKSFSIDGLAKSPHQTATLLLFRVIVSDVGSLISEQKAVYAFPR